MSEVPDPHGDRKLSYAGRFEKLFEASMKELGIELEYRYQSKLYQSGKYDAAIKQALEHREDIAEVLLSLMSDKAKQSKEIDEAEYGQTYYPVSIYSEFTGKDATLITGFDGKALTYECLETKKEGVVEVGKDHNLKLAWKIDWPMRWKHEGVNFEPGGMDHASPGSGFDAGDRLIQSVFDGAAPIHAAYGFVGLQGEAGKMSGSAGTGISPSELLSVYEVPLLRWQYLRRLPKQNFSLAFDTEIFRQYDEFDREVVAHHSKQIDKPRDFALIESFPNPKDLDRIQNPVPFRQLVSLGQIVQWNRSKLKKLLESLGPTYDHQSVEERLPTARNWVEIHNPDQAITLLDQPNQAYAKRLSKRSREFISELVEKLGRAKPFPVKELEDLVYAIPKDPKISELENRKRQRAFFVDVYQLLIGQDTGPRLSTFLWAIDRPVALKLLGVASRGRTKR